MVYVLAAIAVFGHWALSVFTINRLHSTALPHHFMKMIDLVWYSFFFAVPAALVAAVLFPAPSWLAENPTLRFVVVLYAIACYVAAIAAIPVWIRHLTQSTITKRLETNHTRSINVHQRLGHDPSGSLSTKLACRLPTNQVFDLWVHEKTLRLPRLPLCLDGLSIAHLSDLHFTGRVKRSYYDLVVEETNAMDADLVVISGDIIDKRKCFSWLAEVLGKLKSRHGVFFVLGNHDLRIRNEMGLRRELKGLGLIDLGGRSELREIRGYPVAFAGNELPWFAPAANMTQVPLEHPKGRPFRIAVSHSPDQYPWARFHDVDLMLAGHTHGGQIRFPLIGPIFSPSQFGVRYAAGTFYESPTLMHVSRGLSGTRPLRFNCPPELAKLVLRSE